ncbi:MAG: hypothetical protein LUQ38_03165 [Methanotrichaceae archaeon]|nr:hypothetical protein [Methanotrichaceae archaeon]
MANPATALVIIITRIAGGRPPTPFETHNFQIRHNCHQDMVSLPAQGQGHCTLVQVSVVSCVNSTWIIIIALVIVSALALSSRIGLGITCAFIAYTYLLYPYLNKIDHWNNPHWNRTYLWGVGWVVGLMLLGFRGLIDTKTMLSNFDGMDPS